MFYDLYVSFLLNLQMGTEIQRGIDGLFAVCFKNHKAYPEYQIWEIFGRYGHVVSVRCTGDLTGMVFVRYKDYDATRNCLEHLNRTHELHVRMATSNKKPPLPDGPMKQSGRYVQAFVKVICVTCYHETAYCYVRVEVLVAADCEVLGM
jgi:hypothetical protein